MEFYGLRPSRARTCARKAAGLRCLQEVADLRDKGELVECLCTHDALDHTALWLDEAGGYVWTTEPYERDGETIADLISELQATRQRTPPSSPECAASMAPHPPGRAPGWRADGQNQRSWSGAPRPTRSAPSPAASRQRPPSGGRSAGGPGLSTATVRRRFRRR